MQQVNSAMQQNLKKYQLALQQELQRLLKYWIENVPDAGDGFFGKIDHDDRVYPHAPKGTVLNSRILWAFSSAYNFTKNEEYKVMAQRAFNYINAYFIDKDFGGVYWTVDYKGQPLATKKQTYAMAFAVYGLSEYYRCSQDAAAKEKAIALYNDILNHTCDKKYGGYMEAFSREWNEMEELRLSVKDANEKKSMNTHLHVLEAFANLYLIWPDESLKKNIQQLLQLFSAHIINKKNHHLHLFFQEDWTVKSGIISYGHDIEAAWLLQEAAEIIQDEKLTGLFKVLAVKMAVAAAEGLDKDGGLWYEYDPSTNHLIKEKHSWPQAEAMIGFFNAWQITGDETYLQASLKSWHFTENNILDKKGGEWVWGINEDYTVMTQEDKAGLWKCPYHNSRACMEIIKRIGRENILSSSFVKQADPPLK